MQKTTVMFDQVRSKEVLPLNVLGLIKRGSVVWGKCKVCELIIQCIRIISCTRIIIRIDSYGIINLILFIFLHVSVYKLFTKYVEKWNPRASIEMYDYA